MKIASYNIWNDERGMPLREQQIVHEIQTLNSDILCLQEVTAEAYHRLTRDVSKYKHSCYQQDDGLAIFSQHSILTEKGTKYALLAACAYENQTCLVVNVHLPWDSILQQEQAIVHILQEAARMEANYAILTGDFNCSENSSVHQYITGQRSLLNSEANPYWDDLAEAYADITNTQPENTLDLRNNPRWKGRNVVGKSGRLDRIYLRDGFPKPSPQLIGFSLFGKEVDEQSGYCASDHYGVAAEIRVE
jgi:endonuclease/exonuclease/phosphatase family metal-dependent hydrolase